MSLKQQQRRIRAHYEHILFPPDWPHAQDGEITEKRIGELEWEYAVASKNIYDTLRDIDEGDDSDDGDNTEVTGTNEATHECTVSRGTLHRDQLSTPITDWARSDEAPPGWRPKTLPLTPDATVKAIHKALEKVAQQIDPIFHVHRLTVSRSGHILASIFSKHSRRRELLHDIIHQGRINEDLDQLEVSITHSDGDDKSIPITFDLAWILLVYHIENTYSHTIQEWIQAHPIRIVDRQNPSAIEPPFENECIRIRWTGSGVDIWSGRRILETVDTQQVNRSKARRPQQRTQSNTISK